MPQAPLTKEQAIALSGTEFWKEMTPRQIAEFQMEARLLCMPFRVFHKAVEEALGRPVWTHEFAFPDRLATSPRQRGRKSWT